MITMDEVTVATEVTQRTVEEKGHSDVEAQEGLIEKSQRC